MVFYENIEEISRKNLLRCIYYVDVATDDIYDDTFVHVFLASNLRPFTYPDVKDLLGRQCSASSLVAIAEPSRCLVLVLS